jgi:predicted AlkP superfamily phosphohydrolase/phosphomutase
MINIRFSPLRCARYETFLWRVMATALLPLNNGLYSFFIFNILKIVARMLSKS